MSVNINTYTFVKKFHYFEALIPILYPLFLLVILSTIKKLINVIKYFFMDILVIKMKVILSVIPVTLKDKSN